MISLVDINELRKQSKREKQLSDSRFREMPYVYSLFLMALSSGLSIYETVNIVSNHSPIVFKTYIEKVIYRIENGKSFSDAITDLQSIAEYRLISNVLLDSFESGTTSTSSIEHLFHQCINRMRRDANTEVKKLTIKMLFPLVLCILPAFVVLSIVPAIINGFSGIDW